MDDFLSKAKAVMIGHAVGDALGVPVEFSTREALDNSPVTDMLEFGTHSVPKGTWSDDTSMSLCTLAALKHGYSLQRIMHNFGRWYFEDKFTATGKTFDIGNTCSTAIENYFKYGKALQDCGLNSDYSNGNGSLMRIHPIALYLYNISQSKRLLNLSDIKIIENVSALTHAHPRSQLACLIYCSLLWIILNPPKTPDLFNKNLVRVALRNLEISFKHYRKSGSDFCNYFNEMKYFNRIVADIENLPREEIQSDGYVVHTLEAAIWCLLTTDNYKDCVLKAVNLGDVTDTTAAIAGGLAGALYGYDAIPEEWRSALLRRDYIENLCERVFK